MKTVNQEKLVLTLLVRDITAAINAAMRRRKVTLRLDYSKAIPHLIASSNMSVLVEEAYMWANPRTRRAIVRSMDDPTLRSFQIDIEQRLHDLQAYLFVAAEKPFNKKPICKLQVRVKGVRNMVLTLCEVNPGQIKSETDFQTPDGETP